MSSIDVERLRQTYPKGTVIKLYEMQGEPQMPTGLLGTVVHVDDIGQIHCKWKNGSTLALNVEVDKFRVDHYPEVDHDER